jgi:8-oxo-dGTP diphosphatase
MRQADELAARFGSLTLDRLLSSPAVRCRQTLAPLSRQSGLPIEDAAELTEGAPLAGALDLVRSLTATTALCGHGDLIPEIVEALAAEGMSIDHPPRCQKAAVWTLEVRDGTFVAGRHTPPPG